MSLKLYLPVAIFVCTAPMSASEPAEAIASIGGQAVYANEISPTLRVQLRQLRTQEYEIKRRAAEEVVNRKLLESEAARQGTTVGTLLEREADLRVGEPTDLELEAFYLGQRDRLNRPFTELKQQLRQALNEIRLQAVRQDYIARLRAGAAVTILVRPPKVDIAADPRRMRGHSDAPVTIVEFSDFQCGFCRTATTTIKELLVKYDGRVRLSYRDYPLVQIHPEADRAAEAARCAGEQGKFWEYHDLLFAAKQQLTADVLTRTATTLNLNADTFRACMVTRKYKSEVEKDIEDAKQLGLTGTPAFFINGIFVSGAQSAAVFEGIIEDELASARR
jgi:protein-disulfide isomerase